MSPTPMLTLFISGALFFAVLFNALVSQSTLISFFLGRPVLEKQKHFAMYRPSAYYLSIVAMDIPYAVVQGKLKKAMSKMHR